MMPVAFFLSALLALPPHPDANVLASTAARLQMAAHKSHAQDDHHKVKDVARVDAADIFSAHGVSAAAVLDYGEDDDAPALLDDHASVEPRLVAAENDAPPLQYGDE